MHHHFVNSFHLTFRLTKFYYNKINTHYKALVTIFSQSNYYTAPTNAHESLWSFIVCDLHHESTLVLTLKYAKLIMTFEEMRTFTYAFTDTKCDPPFWW